MSFTPLTFSGVSKYSTDFQSILTRATSIASLPLTALQNQNSDVIQQEAQLSSLSTSISGLGRSLVTLAGFGENKALSASSTDSSVATALNTGATTAATYTLNEVTSLASIASETSASGYADSQATQVSSTGIVKLTVGSESRTIDITQKNTLVGLRDAINSLGVGVSASIITAGAKNYLSLTATTNGQTTLTLKDDPEGVNTNLLTTSNQGSDAVFKLNGIPVTRKTNTVNDLVPGLSFMLVGKSASAVTFNLTTDRSKISNALSSFVANFNAANDAVGQQVGANAGLLSGDFLVRQIQEDLRHVSSYSASSGEIKNLTQLGVTFDSSGKAVFDSSVFDQLPDSSITSALSFFGSSRTGVGELAQRFTQITDPVSGLAKLQQDAYAQTDTRLRDQIATLTDRITEMQAGLNAKLQVADALLAQLESQQNLISAGIQSMTLVTFGKNTSN